MENLFAPYKLAVIAKAKGFDVPCFGEYVQWGGSVPELTIYQDVNEESNQYFTTECKAPLYQQLTDWFREKHNIVIHIQGLKEAQFMFSIYQGNYNDKPRICDTDYYSGLRRVIEEAFKLIETK